MSNDMTKTSLFNLNMTCFSIKQIGCMAMVPALMINVKLWLKLVP